MSKADLLLELKSELSRKKISLHEKVKGMASELKEIKTNIPRYEKKEPAPLSFSQQRLWFLDQLVPNSPAYNVVMAFHLSGNIMTELLTQCFREIIRRHEVLRTTFQSNDGHPVQIVHPDMTLPVKVMDLTHYPGPERETRFRQSAEAEAMHLFDLSRGPLVRIVLFKMETTKYILLINAHHIVIDGWSWGIFIREINTLYSAFSRGKCSPLPELPIQYSDFSIWQQQWLKGEILDEQLKYWKEKLGSETTELKLPLDRTRPPIQSFRGDSLQFILSRSLSESLKTLSRRENATLFMVLLAALKILLYRYTGQKEIIVGTPTANRSKAEIENLIGFFVNSLVLKTDLSGNPCFLDVLKRVRETAYSAYNHQDIPFELLVDELQPERNMSQNPLFQVCFIFQSFQMPQTGPEIYFEEVEEIRNHTSKFDLWIQLVERDGILTGDVEYNSDIFNRTTITGFLESYEVLLEGIVADPGKQISHLPVLTARMKNRVLYEWNNTAVKYPRQGMCLHELIEARAAEKPDLPAVIFERQRLTYRELNGRANQLARILRKMGVGPDTLVGICMERSFEMVTGLLGILKAGGAYVPMDPSYPQDRLAFMMSDARTRVLLTQQKLLHLITDYGAEILCLDTCREMMSKVSDRNLSSQAHEDNLAYMIYTSGSTGKPKGAMNVHRGIVNRLLWMQEEYRLDETDRIMQKTPFSFDVSVWEFFWPLIAGACMVVARPEGHKDPVYLSQLIKQEHITTIHFVPSMLRVFLEAGDMGECATLRRVICSGEALPYSVAERFFTCLGAELHNLYGPTEASIDVTYWACRKNNERRIIPIGYPVANTQIYLLDENLNPVPPGVPGELHIGGVQLARGYYNRPELTNEKFIPDPFCSMPEARLYKTGDLARYLPDGAIEFLGRIDSQVKVRGFRIELEEIEAVMEEHPLVQDAVVQVCAPEDSPEHKQLVSYLIIDENELKKTAKGNNKTQVSDWQEVFNKVYNESQNQQAGDFNISGWTSSYTGLPIPAVQMEEWVDATVERILRLQPEKVLEIGCGTGLLLSRIAPQCKEYCGTDISAVALDYIKQTLIEKRTGLSGVTLQGKSADDIHDLKKQHFDVVVLNSVVQYFPDVIYLARVLKQIVEIMPHTGSIFIGDVRSLPLQTSFQTDVELERTLPQVSTTQLKHRIRKRLYQEQELLIDPEFFHVIKHELPGISHVEIQLKRGHYKNELTCFRYDVILHKGRKTQSVKEPAWLDWQANGCSIEQIRKILTGGKPGLLGITNIPNKRLLSINHKLDLLESADCPEAVGKVKEYYPDTVLPRAVDPDLWWELGDQFLYHVAVSWVIGKNDGSYEVLMWPGHRTKKESVFVPPWIPSALESRPLYEYTNHPAHEKLRRELTPDLKIYLKKKLPDYMIPNLFMILHEMPVNANGKLDRGALPEPCLELLSTGEDFVPARTPVEKILAEVWSEVLGVEEIGINSSFFELGGDSIHTIQVVSRAKQRGLEFTPQLIFQYNTIAGLANVIGLTQPGSMPGTASALEELSDEKYLPFSLSSLNQETIDRLLSEMPDMEDCYPVTATQENMLYQYVHDYRPGLYIIPDRFRIKGGNFHPEAFGQAWQSLIDQFPVLRTSFRWENPEIPLQIVHRNVRLKTIHEDWRSIPNAEQEKRIREYIEQFKQKGFNLRQAPHTHLAFFRLADDEYVIFYAFNLMLQDGWSFPVIAELLLDYYDAILSGKEVKTKPADTYRKLVAWQQHDHLAGAGEFWEKNLEGITMPVPSLSALTDNRSKPVEPGDPEVLQERRIVPEEMTSALSSLAKKYHLTIYTLMQAAWALLLHRKTGEQDVVFGSIYSGRSAANMELEQSVGLYFNILPVRVHIDPRTVLSDWLGELQMKGVETSRFEHTPLKKIHEWCNIPRERRLFESYLISEQLPRFYSMIEKFSKELNITLESTIAQTEHPLRVEVLPVEKRIFLHINYYQRYFTALEITRMLSDIYTLLEEFIANPERRLKEFINLI